MAEAALLLGQVLDAKYEIERVLGAGGMGVVYSARHLVTGKRVALKWLLPDAASEPTSRERFLREARAAGRISHPNVVDIYDVIECDDTIILVMEYLEGRPLSEVLDAGPLPPTDAIRIMIQVMRGVAAAHDCRVVHRDLKPENIFLCEGSGPLEVKVLDFGVSKMLDARDGLERPLTQTNAIVGTPQFMAPEQIDGMPSEIDARTDIWALGVVLYLALTGHRPFAAERYSALIQAIVELPQPPMASFGIDIDPAIEAVVARALAKARAERWQTVAAMARALEPWSGGVRFEEEASGEWLSRVGPSQKTADVTLVRTSRDARASSPEQCDSRARTAERASSTGGSRSDAPTSHAKRASPISRVLDERVAVQESTRVRVKWLVLAGVIVVLASVGFLGSLWSREASAPSRAALARPLAVTAPVARSQILLRDAGTPAMEPSRGPEVEASAGGRVRPAPAPRLAPLPAAVQAGAKKAAGRTGHLSVEDF